MVEYYLKSESVINLQEEKERKGSGGKIFQLFTLTVE